MDVDREQVLAFGITDTVVLFGIREDPLLVGCLAGLLVLIAVVSGLARGPFDNGFLASLEVGWAFACLDADNGGLRRHYLDITGTDELQMMRSDHRTTAFNKSSFDDVLQFATDHNKYVDKLIKQTKEEINE